MSRPLSELVRFWLRPHSLKLHRKTAGTYGEAEIIRCVEQYDARRSTYKAALLGLEKSLRKSPARDVIHSIRFRTKDPRHLADKLARKVFEKDKRIVPATLFTIDGVTDLGGLRVLHLDRRDWHRIDETLQRLPDWKVVERRAYVRRRDRQDYRRHFSREDIIVSNSTTKRYTSLHYSLKSERETDLIVECQVRTILEEGWGEVDHQFNYPSRSDLLVSEQLDLLNTATRTAADIVMSIAAATTRLARLIPWEAELQLERSAEKVYCLTPDLQWAATYRHLAAHLRDVRHFSYYLATSLSRRPLALQNRRQVIRRLKRARLTSKVFVHDVDFCPLAGDLLLLENAVLPGSDRPSSVVIIGAPAGLVAAGSKARIAPRDQLDFLITRPEVVRDLSLYFRMNTPQQS